MDPHEISYFQRVTLQKGLESIRVNQKFSFNLLGDVSALYASGVQSFGEGNSIYAVHVEDLGTPGWKDDTLAVVSMI